MPEATGGAPDRVFAACEADERVVVVVQPGAESAWGVTAWVDGHEDDLDLAADGGSGAFHVVVHGAEVLVGTRAGEPEPVALEQRRVPEFPKTPELWKPFPFQVDSATTLKVIPLPEPPFTWAGSPGPPAGARAFGLRWTEPSAAVARMSSSVLLLLKVMLCGPIRYQIT